MGSWDVIMLVFFVVVAIGVGLYFLNRWATKRVSQQQSMIEQHKTSMSIYVIDKQKMKAADANLPKAVQSQLPKVYKLVKMPLVKAKVGPQIVTLMCDKAVFDALPLKKTVRVDMAGMYIVSMAGMKSKEEMKKLNKAKNSGGKPWDKLTAKFKKAQ